MVKSVVLIPEYRQNARFQSKLSQLVGPWRKNGLMSMRECGYEEHYCSLFQYRQSPISKIKFRENLKWNYHYYPLIFESEEKLLEVQIKNVFKINYNLKNTKVL